MGNKNTFISSTGEKYQLDMKNKANKLGSGAFADVYKVLRTYDKKPFAAKILKISPDEMRSYEKLGNDRELKILKSIDHPLVMKHVDEIEQNN